MATSNNKFEKLLNFFQKNWIFSVIILTALIISSLPWIKDWINILYTPLSNYLNTFVFEQDGEKVTINLKLRTPSFDVVKVNSSNHFLWIGSEYKWIQYHYPEYSVKMQVLVKQRINDEDIHFDVLTIENSTWKRKDIYFDISSFIFETNSFQELWLPRTETEPFKYEFSRIKELYDK